MVILRPKNGIRMSFTKSTKRRAVQQAPADRQPQAGNGCPHVAGEALATANS
jgi:hypothetical protein